MEIFQFHVGCGNAGLLFLLLNTESIYVREISGLRKKGEQQHDRKQTERDDPCALDNHDV